MVDDRLTLTSFICRSCIINDYNHRISLIIFFAVDVANKVLHSKRDHIIRIFFIYLQYPLLIYTILVARKLSVLIDIYVPIHHLPYPMIHLLISSRPLTLAFNTILFLFILIICWLGSQSFSDTHADAG